MSSPTTSPGVLYVVATPIGNRADLSARAIDILSRVDWVACEDTRHSIRLYPKEVQPPPLIAYHDHNESDKAEYLLGRLLAGESGAVVSDAGTPGISDPGFRLTRACHKAGVRVVPIPGANAAVTALSASGLPSNGFFYAGFLPPKTSARQRFFTQYSSFPYTIILYESCHRITKAVDDLITVMGAQRTLCIAREITKEFETILSGEAGTLRPQLKGKNLKGEFVLIIAPADFTL